MFFMDILTFDLMSIFAYLAALTASTISLIYGILALIPAGPFVTQNLTVGIVLIVLSVTGIMAIGGLISGLLVCFVISSPLLCCTDLFLV